MLTLAINTTSNFAAVALLNGAALVAELDSRRDFHPGENDGGCAGTSDQLPPGYSKKRSKRGQATRRVFPPGVSAMLAPLIHELLESNGLPSTQLELIAVASGPGKFTGIRVGVVTAKTLAYATGKPVVAVNTMDAIAAQVFTNQSADPSRTLHVAVNAQRGQFFTNEFQSLGTWQVQGLNESTLVSQSQFIENLPDQASIAGMGIDGLVQAIDERPRQGQTIVCTKGELTAESVGRYGQVKFQCGQEDDCLTLQPIYFRPSAADEKRSAADPR